MARHTAQIVWEQRDGDEFVRRRYSRAHRWEFDGGVTVPASPSTMIVPAPYSQSNAVDPEEAFVAALSSCHMLFFLDFASRAGWNVSRYIDQATGTMGDVKGRTAFTKVVLRPRVDVFGTRPSIEEIRALHDKAHHACFLANSVTCPVIVEDQVQD